VDFTLTSDQEMLKALVERFVADRATVSAQHSHAAENWALLAEIGLLALPFAEDLGGLAASDVDIATAMEALGRGLVREPVLNEIILAGRLLDAAGTPAQRDHWIPKVVAGEAHLAVAHAEPTTRFDLTRAATRFDHGALTGRKTCVPGPADVVIVTARQHGALHLFLVHADAPGLTRRDYRLIDGSAASELHFTATPAEPLPGGIDCLHAAVDTARIAACAEMIGLMGLLFDTTLDYVRQRQQFGAPIGSFQAIQHRLADVYATLELSRSHLYRCVLAEPPARPAAIAAAKSYISTTAIHLGEECIQLHGGMGVSDEVIIGHAHKRLLVLASLFGDADHEITRYNRAMAETGKVRGFVPEPPLGSGDPRPHDVENRTPAGSLA
jgi:alkylation response protein AidB-like acyl-CoA dehydrogenase